MKQNTRIIILGLLSILIVIVLSFGVTKAFMKSVEQGGNLTEIALSSCAKIKLTGESSIDLSNTYPMSRNRGLQTTPYTFTVTSYCDTYVGFNLYIAPLSENTIDISNIHFILTYRDSKEALMEGVLSDLTSVSNDFSDSETTELKMGLRAKYSDILKIYSDNLELKGSIDLDLYLFLDESVSNDTMDETFKAGVAVKAYDRENPPTLANYVRSLYTGTQGENGLYYHDSTLTNGAGDNSYRYAGANPNNYVCFGSYATACPTDNLYRIIGVIDGKVKLIKYDYNTKEQLGVNGDYVNSSIPSDVGIEETYEGNLKTLDMYVWNNSTSTNSWSESLLNKTNLNTNFINYLGTSWSDKIATTTWKVGGNTFVNIGEVTPSVAYTNEITTPATSTTYSAKIGLMYVSDYVFATSPSAWTLTTASYNNTTATSNNWLYLGSFDWTISRTTDYSDVAFGVYPLGFVERGAVNANHMGVRATFNLKSSVTYIKGKGTISEPIRVGMSKVTTIETKNMTLAKRIAYEYSTNKENSNLYYHDSQLKVGAKDESLRYAGANPDNFICLGSDEEKCPDDNLYRIVGVFGEYTHKVDARLVKVVKYDVANSNLLGTNGNYVAEEENIEYSLGTKTLSIYRWSLEENNSYVNSELIKTNLNINFKNNLGYTWTSTIPYINWNIGPISISDIDNISSISLIDLENATKSTSNQVGLLNLSDYKYSGGDGYFSSEEYWRQDNWLFLGNLRDATFTLIDDNIGIMFYENGVPMADSATGVTLVRPSFYLDVDTMYAGGNGTIDEPIRIIIPHNMRLIPREIFEDEIYIIDLFGLNEDFNYCITQNNQKVETSLDLAKLKQKTIDITCSNSEGKKINEYIMIDDFDAINDEFQNVKNEYGHIKMLYVSPEGETKNIDTISGMVDDVILIRDNINLDGIAEAALQDSVVFVYVPYLSETNRLTLIEMLKEKGMPEACVITNNYLIQNDMALSEFLKEYSEGL